MSDSKKDINNEDVKTLVSTLSLFMTDKWKLVLVFLVSVRSLWRNFWGQKKKAEESEVTTSAKPVRNYEYVIEDGLTIMVDKELSAAEYDAIKTMTISELVKTYGEGVSIELTPKVNTEDS